MLIVEARKMYRANGLIDNFVVYGEPGDYIRFSEVVGSVISTREPTTFRTESEISIEVLYEDSGQELFTSLQNQNNEYFSMKDWQDRNILRIVGGESVLDKLRLFLVDISGRGEGYSYISEYSEELEYSHYSPEWRFHVKAT